MVKYIVMSDRKIQLLRSKKMHIILIFSFVLIGAGFIILSQAAVNTASIEAEVTTPLPPARLVQDSNASKGNAVRFSATTPSGTGMSVDGNTFKKDGAAFYPKGFNSIGILQPDNCPRKKGDPTTAAANFNQNMFTALKNTWKGNIIRLQVSQKGSDPQDSELKSGHAAYLTKVSNAVSLARSNGIVVILSMQDQTYSCGSAHPLPSSETLRAWQTLAPLYKNNPYVMFELFNEPVNQTGDADWAQWRNGGSTPLSNNGYDVVGHQALVTAIRATGANNVLIASGANKGGKLQGLWQSATKNYMLTDTLATPQIGLAIHPYYYHIGNNTSLASDTSNWESRFGYMRNTSIIPLNKQVPIISTEWNAFSDCYAGQAARTPEFLNYLKSKDIGMAAHAIDIAGLIVTNVPGWQPSSFGANECDGLGGSDAGQVLQSFYAAN
ncbi:MAG: endoglucanase [Patescibacteria group bacterium]|nr:endoglucanase [Patescibacteria group bacterium]